MTVKRPPIGTQARALHLHAVTYHEDCVAALASIGLTDFRAGYFASRTAPLGRHEPVLQRPFLQFLSCHGQTMGSEVWDVAVTGSHPLDTARDSIAGPIRMSERLLNLRSLALSTRSPHAWSRRQDGGDCSSPQLNHVPDRTPAAQADSGWMYGATSRSVCHRTEVFERNDVSEPCFETSFPYRLSETLLAKRNVA